MIKSLTYVFAAFFILVIGIWLISSLGTLLGPGGSFAFPSIVPQGFSGGGGSGGLTAVNFDLFAKNGKGYSYITQGYGYTPYSYMYINHWHNGIDIGANYGAPIYSPANGIVIATGDQDNYCPRLAFGRYVVVEDDTNHLVLLFAHLGTISVKPLQVVKIGDLLATVGESGNETGPHLHFSIFQSGGFNMNPAHGCGPYPTGHDVNPFNYLGKVYQ
jgi:murein DD-endopeptidase MepM/ murein hydrolase activator NlpD